MPSLQHLPPELICIISDLAAPQITSDPPVWERRHQSAMAKTCRRLYEIVNPRMYNQNLNRDSPFLSCVMWSALENKTEPIMAGIRYGADLDQCRYDRAGVAPRDNSPTALVLYHPRNSHRRVTPLQVALQKGSRDAVKVLLENGASPHVQAAEFCQCNDPLCVRPYALHTAIKDSPIKDAVELLVTLGGAVWEEEDRSVLPRLVTMGRDDLVQHILNLTSADASNAALYHAVTRQDKELFSMVMLRPGIDVNFADRWGGPVLHHALKNGQIDMAAALLAYPGIQPDKGAAILAARHGNLEALKLLLDFPTLGVDYDLGDSESPLHAAARAGNLQIVEYLVQTLQVEVAMQCRYGDKPIHAAVEGNNMQVVQLLLSHPQVDAGAMTDGDQTALHIAIEGRSLEMVELLLAREDVDPTSGYAELGLLTDLKPLHFAALHGDIKILQALMAHPKISIGMKDSFGRTALHYAALGVTENLIKSEDVFHFLLEQPDISPTDEDSDGFNVLHFLSVPCYDQSEEDFHLARSLMNLCIAKGVPVDKTSPWGTAFHIAVHGSLGILRNAAHLLSCGADPSIIPTPFVSVTPLHHCLAHAASPGLESEQLQVLHALIEAGIDLEQFSDYEVELNPLEVPAWEFDTSIPPIDGSALAYAVLCARSVKCAEVLLEAGADVTRLAYAGAPFRETHEFHPDDDAASLVGFLLRTVCPGGHFKNELLTDWLKEMLKLLLRHGAQIDDAISLRWSPIWIAVDAAVQEELGLLNFLLENSTKSNCQKHFLKQLVRSARRDAKPSVTALMQALQDFLSKFWPGWEEESEEEAVGRELSPEYGSDDWDFGDDIYQHVGSFMLQWMAEHGPLAADEAIWNDESMSDDLDLGDDLESEEDDLDLEEDSAIES